MFTIYFKKVNRHMLTIIVLLVLLAISGVGVGHAQKATSPDANVASCGVVVSVGYDFRTKRCAGLEPFADISATPKHITQNADWLYDKLTGFGIVNESEVLAVVFHNADGDAWIDVLEMKSLIVRDAPSKSNSSSHAAADAQPADLLLYKFLVIVGLDDI